MNGITITVGEPKGPDYVMVTDEESDGAGATTWWSLAGEVHRDRLEAEAKAHGITAMPRLVEPETAVSRALACLRGKRRIIRLIRKGKWAVVEEAVDVTRDSLRHWEGPTIELNKIGRLALTGSTPEEAQQVRDAYDHALEYLDTNDISAWLLAGVERLGGISLRRTGGIYYVPPQQMAEWRRHIDALATCNSECSVYTVPTVKMTADGARAILDSLTADVTAQASKLSEDVVSGELGLRGLANRRDDSRNLLAKVSQYEELLGQRLERLRAVVAQVDVDVAAAALALEAMEDEAS